MSSTSVNLKLANGKDLARNEVGLIKSKIHTEIPIPVVPGVNSDSGLWISGKNTRILYASLPVVGLVMLKLA